IGFIATGPAHTALEVVRYQQFRHTAKELERPHMAVQPVRQGLTGGGFGIGVIGRPQDGYKDLRRSNLAGGSIHDRHRGAAVVDETLLASPVMLAQGALLGLLPVLVASAELGVTVAAVGHTGGVLLPQQLPGHALALELLMQAGAVRLLQPGSRAPVGSGVE